MALQEGLDPSRAMDRMVIEKQGLAGQQERQQDRVQVGHEHTSRQRALVAPLAGQALLRQDRHGVHRLARRDGFRVAHPLLLGSPSIRQSHIEVHSGFIEVEALVEGDGVDLLVLALRFGAMLFGVFLRVVGGLFFASSPSVAGCHASRRD